MPPELEAGWTGPTAKTVAEMQPGLIAAGIYALFSARRGLVNLRGVGRWRQVYEWWKKRPDGRRAPEWYAQYPLARGFFYQVPIFGGAGVVLVILGLVL